MIRWRRAGPAAGCEGERFPDDVDMPRARTGARALLAVLEQGE
ncbi:hypothetical protein [Streptomyces sp. CB03238]|nr:hypothetical protein [Streptomyces sp. CB03238]